MAMREILLRKATFLRAKDEGYAIAARSLSAHQRRQFGQRNHWLLGLAMLERACAYDQRAVGYCLCQILGDFGVLEQVRGADRGLCLAPVRLIRSDDGEALEAEVGHGSRRRSYIEGIARGGEDYFEAVALRFAEQGIHCSVRQF
jgi:hypothetical protein